MTRGLIAVLLAAGALFWVCPAVLLAYSSPCPPPFQDEFKDYVCNVTDQTEKSGRMNTWLEFCHAFQFSTNLTRYEFRRAFENYSGYDPPPEQQEGCVVETHRVNPYNHPVFVAMTALNLLNLLFYLVYWMARGVLHGLSHGRDVR